MNRSVYISPPLWFGLSAINQVILGPTFIGAFFFLAAVIFGAIILTCIAKH